jgi:hypothetical protein
MFNNFEKICKFIYRERKNSQIFGGQKHPNEESLVCFLEAKLSKEENTLVLKHLLICDQCSEYLSTQFKIQPHMSLEVPTVLLEKVNKLVSQRMSENLLEIFLKLKEKVMEIIQTTGDVLVGQELIPAPVLRSRKIEEFKGEVSILKDLQQIRILAKIQNKDTKSFNLTVSVKDRMGQKNCKDLRVTLIKDEIELESYTTDSSGSCLFENILPGNYLVEVSRKDQKVATIDLKVKV